MTTTITSCPLTHHNYVHHYVITELYTVHYKYKPTEPRGLSHSISTLGRQSEKIPNHFQKWLDDTDYQQTKPSVRSFTLSPCYSHISPSIFCDFFVTIILPTTCTCILSPLLLYTDYPTSTPNPKNPSWWRPKGWNASRVTPDKITTTTMSFYASVLLPSYITNRNHCSLAATIPPHSTMSFHLFFTPTMLLINTKLYNHTIKYNACVGPTTYFIYKIGFSINAHGILYKISS